MKKLLLALTLFIGSVSTAQYQPTAANLAARKDFQDMKFGLFIHWGASSVLGNGEWVMQVRNIHYKDYGRLVNIFNPHDFNAPEWVSMAKNAGMKYITFITRHHDGFSNWDTKQSDWKITNTPYGKDVLKLLSEECRKQGIKLFLYYSLLDWYRSDYQYETGRTGKGTGRTEKSNWSQYIAFMKAQLTELLTNYGEISGIWFDGHWDQLDNDHDKKSASKVDWKYDEIYKLIHTLQPNCLIGNNHHLSPLPGEDFQMFEKDLPGHNTTGFGGADISALPLESCETMNNSWGYNMTDRNYKSGKQLIHYLVNAAGRNANFLLNVGPMPDGKIQTEFIDTLKVIGNWMQRYGESIYGTRGDIIAPQDWGIVTAKANKLYVHILKRTGDYFIFLPNLKQKIKHAEMFSDKRSIRYKQEPEGTFLYFDSQDMDSIDTIIVLTRAE